MYTYEIDKTQKILLGEQLAAQRALFAAKYNLSHLSKIVLKQHEY